jgi:SAM-dependent methyltransferase
VQDALEAVWVSWAAKLESGAVLLDLATGAGAVLRIIGRHRPDLVLIGVDRATLPPAPAGLTLHGGVDIERLPQHDGSVGAVSSQFGIEYAERGALGEAARVLAPGGRLRCVVHHRSSEAVHHNRARLDALTALLDAGLFPLARRESAGLRDPPLIQAVTAAVQAHRRQSIVGELPEAVRRALAGPDPLRRIAALERMATAERSRLSAMAAAARDERGARDMVRALVDAGLVAHLQPVLANRPVAWLIDAERPA